MAFYRTNVRSKNRKRRVILILCVCIILGIYMLFNIVLMPVMKTAAVNKAKIVAVNTINNAVGTVLRQDNISYEKLISFDKDENGYITAVESDTMQINLLKYDITREVVKELGEVGKSEIGIPLGTIVGGQMFTGRGPLIRIRFQPVGNVNSEITSTFSSAGINQTRQQILLDVKADITVMTSSYMVSTDVTSNFIIADSVIVGNVPNSFVVVDGSGSSDDTANKIFTYGQAGKSASSSASSRTK